MILQKLPRTLLTQRNLLLQESLRPGFLEYPIVREYPIVLSEHSLNYSYCAYDRIGGQDQLLAHANMWPRTLIDGKNGDHLTVGFIGNVATHAEFRGRGIMQKLLDYLWGTGKAAGLKALILWSDLNDFYNKMGYEQKGHEKRIIFGPDSFASRTPGKTTICDHHPHQIKTPFLKTLFSMRHSSCVTLARSPKEFKTLLSIPDTILLTARNQHQALCGYAILGKGFDMPGVIHEWGTQNPEILLDMIQLIIKVTQFDQLMLLSPDLNEVWTDSIRPWAQTWTEHPLGFVNLDANQKAKDMFQDSFIWGLDTI